jgi:hypothetical protein
VPNRLAQEASPYLLQHANNPVDWYPWGHEALARAAAEDKPIFLSIGYSACHWCHVMEHESFEDPAIAAALNENFVCIKVDREERPDLDTIYMQAVQLMTGRGGWPMSVFLTPDGKPFFGGTYWPPEPRMGMPGFNQVIAAVAEAWQQRRQAAKEQAELLAEHVRAHSAAEVEPGELTSELLEMASFHLRRSFDSRHGGFGGAPKFPHPIDVRLLLRLWKRTGRDDLLEMVTLTLDRMAAGGIYDHLGGGFARYSVDERWLVPHFEKMLYDNALLAAAYVEAYQATREERFARTARETLDYVLRDMTHPEGAFFSSQDADSEGHEGKFYLWTPAEIQAVLGPERSKTFCYVYDVTDEGNFEGSNILNLPKTIAQCAKMLHREEAELRAELAESRQLLLQARAQRVWPGRDDKILASWNALMIDALALAAGALDEPRYLQAAMRAADFVHRRMQRPDGRLVHSWRDGQARFDAYLDDYTYLIGALVTLYEATFERRYLNEALALAERLQAHFADRDGGGYFYTADDHEALIARPKDVLDNPTPSGNAMAATALLRLGKLCGRSDLLDAARSTLQTCAEFIRRLPTATGQLLVALDWYLGPAHEIVVTGKRGDPATTAVVADLRRRFIPRKVVACWDEVEAIPAPAPLGALLAGKEVASSPRAYVCQDYACQAPATGREEIVAAWERLEGTSRK